MSGGVITKTPVVLCCGTLIVPPCESVGLLKSFAQRWAADPRACALVPFDRFVTGRIPSIEDGYPFPYIALFIPGGGGHGRSDRTTWARRVAILHIWVDMGALELGEEIAEEARRIFCNQSWMYSFGSVMDVLDHGPPTIIDVNEPSFQYHELVKTMTLCLQQNRVDSCNDICLPCSSGSVSPSSSSYTIPLLT